MSIYESMCLEVEIWMLLVKTVLLAVFHTIVLRIKIKLVLVPSAAVDGFEVFLNTAVVKPVILTWFWFLCSTNCVRWRRSSLAPKESLTWWPTTPAPSATQTLSSRSTTPSALTWRVERSPTSSSLILVRVCGRESDGMELKELLGFCCVNEWKHGIVALLFVLNFFFFFINMFLVEKVTHESITFWIVVNCLLKILSYFFHPFKVKVK